MEYIEKQWESTIRKILVYALPVVFLLPLYTSSGYFFPFIVPRNLAFRIIVGVAFSLFSMLLVSRPKAYLPKKNYIVYALLSLFGILTLSSFINGDFLYSFWSDYERMEGLLNLIFVLAFIFTLAGVYRTKQDWLYILRFTLFISLPVALVGLSQHVGADLLLASSGGERVSSTLGNATYLAAYTMFHIFFALYLIQKITKEKFTLEIALLAAFDLILLVTEKKFGTLGLIFDHALLAAFFILPQAALICARFLQNEKYQTYATKAYFIILIALNFFILFNTQTRGALIGLVAGLFFVLGGFIFLQQKNVQLQRAAIGALIVLVLTVGSIFYFKDSKVIQDNKALNRVASISLDDTTARTRLFNWEAAWLGWQEKPILGWGEERYYQIFNEHFPEEIYRHAGSRVWFDRPHNVVIQYFVSGGLLGGLAYLAIFATAVWALFTYWRRTHDLPTFLLFTGVLVAYVIQNLLVFDSLNTYILFALVLGFIIGKTGKRGAIEEVKPLIKKPPIVIAIVVLIATYSVTVPIANANKSFIDAIVGLNTEVRENEISDESITKTEQAIERIYFGRYELRQHYGDSVRGYLQNPDLPKEQKIKLVESAEKLLLRSIDEQPQNVRHYAFLGSLYVESQNIIPDNAPKNIDLTLRALELSPTRTHLFYALGRSYLVAGDAEKALESFGKALELSPKVPDAHINYLAALITTKQGERALEHLSDMREAINRDLTPVEYIQVAAMFRSTKDIQSVFEVIEIAKEAHPESIEILQMEFNAYIEQGDTDKALEVAERITEIDSSYANDLELFRRQLNSGGLQIE